MALSRKEQIIEKINKIQKYLNYTSIFVLLVLVLSVLYIDFFIYPNLALNPVGNAKWINFYDTFKGLLINFIPVLIISVFIAPIVGYISDLNTLANDNDEENPLDDILFKLESIESGLDNMHYHPEIVDFNSSYPEFDWSNHLDEAMQVDLCMFYSGRDWNLKQQGAFEDFFNNGGILNLYLPNPLKITHRFFQDYKLNGETIGKIFRTAKKFREFQNKSQKGKLKIHLVNSGLNYMFARITKQDDEKIFLYSPYQNNWDKTHAPVLLLKEDVGYDNNLSVFIEQEMNFLKGSQYLPRFEEDRFVTWDTDKRNNRVFVSLALHCTANCKFCYVDSIISKQKSKDGQSEIGKIIAHYVLNDDKFVKGPKGTIILLGGFTDPFMPDNFKETIEFINEVAEYGNYIHIATRFGLGNRKIQNLFNKDCNVIFNYSISTLDKKIELGNRLYE